MACTRRRPARPSRGDSRSAGRALMVSCVRAPRPRARQDPPPMHRSSRGLATPARRSRTSAPSSGSSGTASRRPAQRGLPPIAACSRSAPPRPEWSRRNHSRAASTGMTDSRVDPRRRLRSGQTRGGDDRARRKIAVRPRLRSGVHLAKTGPTRMWCSRFAGSHGPVRPRAPGRPPGCGRPPAVARTRRWPPPSRSPARTRGWRCEAPCASSAPPAARRRSRRG